MADIKDCGAPLAPLPCRRTHAVLASMEVDLFKLRYFMHLMVGCTFLILIGSLHAEDQSELAQINAARELNELWRTSFDKSGKYPDGHSPSEHYATLGVLLRIPTESSNYVAARALSDQFSVRAIKIAALERSKGPLLPQDASIELGTLDRSYGLLEGSFTLNNPNRFTIADVKVHCDITAPSGTTIEQKDFTVFQVIPARGHRTIKGFKFGLWPQQGKSVGCHTTGYARRDP